MHSTAPRTSRTPQRLPTAPPARPPETRSRRLGGRGRAPPPPPSRRPPPTPPRRHRERHHHLPATRVHHRPRRGDRRRHPRLVVARQRYRRSRLLPDPGRLPRTPVQQARGHCPPPRWRRSRRVHPARVRAHPNRGLPVTAADRPSDTDNARAEQRSEYTVQQTAAHFARKVQRVSDRIRSTDYQRSVSDIVALDNVEGFLDRIARDDLDVFAAGRAETTTATTEDTAITARAAEVIDRAIFEYGESLPADAIEDAVKALHVRGLLATARTRPTREQIESALTNVLSNAMNHPDPVAVLGKDTAPLRAR